MKQIIHMVLNLSPQTGWNLSECDPIITNLMKRCQKHGVQLQVTMCREGEEPVVFDTPAPDTSAPDTTASETTASDTVRQGLPSSQTICMDLTDARLYRSLASVLFALIIRLKMSDCDVPVDFGGDDVFGVHIHGFYLTTLPRHHLMLRDPYAQKHVEDYEAADRQLLECRRLIRDGIRKFSDEEFRKEINLPIKVRKREAPFIKVLDHAFLQLILFVEKLSADKMLTETMRAALGKLADGAYEEALKMLADGSCEDSSNEAMDGAGSGGRSLYLRTPDELMLRYLILQTHAMEPIAAPFLPDPR